MTNPCRRHDDRSAFPRPGILGALVVALAVMAALSGCSSNEPISENQLALIKAQMATATFSGKCEGPCNFAYKDPRDKVHLPRQTNGWDFANNLVNKSVGVAPWAAVTKIAADGFKAAGHNTSNSYNMDSSNEGDVVDRSHVGDLINDSSNHHTATPTIVEQPAPLVVNQPRPIIVKDN